jgi:hypothetical protein
MGVLLASLLAFVTIAYSQTTGRSKDAPADLERMLLGEWRGPACGGDWIYAEDGTFTARHYSPGGNRLSGTWEVQWKALPPTLVRTCKASDDPDLVGISWEVRLVQLDKHAFAYQHEDQYPDGHRVRFSRMTGK